MPQDHKSFLAARRGGKATSKSFMKSHIQKPTAKNSYKRTFKYIAPEDHNRHLCRFCKGSWEQERYCYIAHPERRLGHRKQTPVESNSDLMNVDHPDPIAPEATISTPKENNEMDANSASHKNVSDGSNAEDITMAEWVRRAPNLSQHIKEPDANSASHKNVSDGSNAEEISMAELARHAKTLSQRTKELEIACKSGHTPGLDDILELSATSSILEMAFEDMASCFSHREWRAAC